MAQNVIGIDLGTRSIKIYNKSSDTILNEKNMIAIENKTKVYAIGDEAYEMYEKVPDPIVVIFPIKFGVIADIQNMQNLLERFVRKVKTTKGAFQSNDFCIAVPTNVTEVEKRAFSDLISSSKVKAKKITVVEKPVADGVGAGIDVDGPQGNMVVNFGADTTEITVLSLGGIVISKLVKVGGNRLDENICSFVKKKYNLIIGMKTAETLKRNLGDAVYMTKDSMKVYGRDIVSGLPMERTILAESIYEAINDTLQSITGQIKMILERTPPELAADIIDTGIYLTGGSAELRNFDQLIHQETELKVNIPPNPSECVVRGIAKIVTDPQYASMAYVPREKIIN